MKLSAKTFGRAAGVLLAAQLVGCSTLNAVKEGVQSDAQSGLDWMKAKKNEVMTPDTHQEIADKTGTTLETVTAFNEKCEAVNQVVEAKRTSPIYQIENKTYELACTAK